jgi:hypothetical protein
MSSRRPRELTTQALLTPVEYYRREEIRARMLDGCGAGPDTPPSAAYVVGLGAGDGPVTSWEHVEPRPLAQIGALWDVGADISRSLWDASHLIFTLELDYQNVDQPWEPFLRPAEVFFKLEPTYRASMRTFRAFGLPVRTTVTGRGYQFAGQIRLDHALVDSLAALAPTPAWFAGVEGRRPRGVTTPLTVRQASAWAGLGLLIEYIAHRILAAASPEGQLPVVLNGTPVGTGVVGRECVSIDFTHVGDPLDVRHIRLPFSTYQSHRLRPDIFGPLAAAQPPLAAVPRSGTALMTLLAGGRGLAAGVRAAPRSDSAIPSITAGLEQVLTAYLESPLAAFHRDFYDARQMNGHDAVALDDHDLPPCVATALAWPNDLLLRPEYIQHLVRVLMARGQRPAEIAAVVLSAYDADHGWGYRWSRLDARTRAEFDVRVFAGMIATRLDTLVDFNCVSAQEKGICPRDGCSFDLRRDCDRLLGVTR